MQDPVLDGINDKLLRLDPVAFVEKYLKIEGEPFRLHGNGWRPFADIYRYIGVKALEKGSKPVIIVAGRQVGKTSLASALEMYFMGSGLFGNGVNPPIRVIHAFPQLEMAFAYSKVKLNAMIADSLIDKTVPKSAKIKSYMQSLIDTSSESNDSLQFKQFVGGNHLWIESTGVDGNRLRGKTVDVMFFDEVQKMFASAISNSAKVLTQAKYGEPGQGIQVYFGTPLLQGSVYWDMWAASSQQYYYLGCGKCKKHFPLYTPQSNEWENTWLYGYIVRCSHCGYEQDKNEAAERGKWVATKDPSESKYIGFHMSQLYIPTFTKERVIAEKPENNPVNTERTYQNEVLGEFYKGEATIMTKDQVREMCGDPGRKFRASISTDEDQLVFLGIDIGEKSDLENLVDTDRVKSSGQSYSAAVVIAITGPNRISIEYATKFKRNDLASKKGIIDELMRRYSCNLGVIDLGYTRDLSEILQTEYGEKMLSSSALSRVNDKMKFNADVFPKVISFEKDYMIAELYEQMKKGNIRMPLGDYEKISWLIDHCINFEIKPSISRGGDITPKYVKSGNTDGFSALLNAYIAYKYYISNGFNIKIPSLMKGKKDDRPPVLGASIKFHK